VSKTSFGSCMTRSYQHAWVSTESSLPARHGWNLQSDGSGTLPGRRNGEYRPWSRVVLTSVRERNEVPTLRGGSVALVVGAKKKQRSKMGCCRGCWKDLPCFQARGVDMGVCILRVKVPCLKQAKNSNDLHDKIAGTNLCQSAGGSHRYLIVTVLRACSTQNFFEMNRPPYKACYQTHVSQQTTRRDLRFPATGDSKTALYKSFQS
jgi:hypothetical protein